MRPAVTPRARRLALRRETLTEIGSDDLAMVAGGDVLPTSPLGDCVGNAITKTQPLVSRLYECDSLFNPCVTSTCEG